MTFQSAAYASEARTYYSRPANRIKSVTEKALSGMRESVDQLSYSESYWQLPVATTSGKEMSFFRKVTNLFCLLP